MYIQILGHMWLSVWYLPKPPKSHGKRSKSSIKRELLNESRGQYQEEKIAGSNPPTLSGELQEQTLVQGSWWPSGRLQVADS